MILYVWTFDIGCSLERSWKWIFVADPAWTFQSKNIDASLWFNPPIGFVQKMRPHHPTFRSILRPTHWSALALAMAVPAVLRAQKALRNVALSKSFSNCENSWNCPTKHWTLIGERWWKQNDHFSSSKAQFTKSMYILCVCICKCICVCKICICICICIYESYEII